MDAQEVLLRKQIAGFRDGSLSLHAFREWFRVQKWEADPPADWPLIHLVLGVDKRLATFNSGDFTTDQLRASLLHCVELVDGHKPTGDDPLEVSLPMVRTVATIKSRSKRPPV